MLFFSGVFAHQNPGSLKDAGETAGKCRLLITVPKNCCDYHSCSCVFRDHSAWKQSLPEHSRGYLLIWPSMPLAGNSASSCLRNELYRWVEISIFFRPMHNPILPHSLLLPNSLHADQSDRLKSSRSKMISIWNIAIGKARIKIALCCSTVDLFVMLGWMREWP